MDEITHKLAPFLLILASVLPARAQEDPCRNDVKKEEYWFTRSGCLRVPLDHSDPEGPLIPIYYELSEPMGRSIGSMIVFHGGPGFPRRHLQSQGPLWEGIRLYYRVLYFHQRGTGWSGRITDPQELRGREHLYSLDRIVDDTAILHDQLLDGARAVLMGKSAGGFLALKYALARPDVVSAVVVAATSAHHGYLSNRSDEQNSFLRQLADRYPGLDTNLREGTNRLDLTDLVGEASGESFSSVSELVESVFLDLSYTLHGQFEIVAIARQLAQGETTLLKKRLATGRKTLRSTGMESLPVLNNITCRELMFGRTSPETCRDVPEGKPYDIRENLKQISLPVLVLSGLYDPILPPKYQQEIAEGLGGPVTLRVLNASAHMLFEEQPAACARYVFDFLNIPSQHPPQLPSL